MRFFWILILAILVFLATSSGLAKIMQVPRDVEFFGRYGFNNPMIIGFGALQLLGGVLLVLQKTRVAGSVVVFLTFLLSLVFLLLDGNLPLGIITVLAMSALVAIALRAKRATL